MGNESENVLVGVATLAIRQPNDALAEWSTAQKYAAYSHSVKLSKVAGGNDGSTHLQITPPTGITMQAFEDGIEDDSKEYSFRYLNGPVDLRANFVQFEFRFEDPNSDAWCEITYVEQQNHLAAAAWGQVVVEHEGDFCGVGGVAEDGSSFFGWGTPGLIPVGAIVAAINDEATFNVVDCSDWILTRVRVELWEGGTTRHSYIGEVTINSVLYTITPGGTAPALSLSGPYVDVGYTEDGVSFEASVDTTDIRVEEEVYPIDRLISAAGVKITCNMSESSLANLHAALAGSVLSGNILTLGAGVLQKLSIRLTGLTPDGKYIRSYDFPKVTATGTVGMSFRRAEKTIIPLTFEALKPSVGPVGTFVDNVA